MKRLSIFEDDDYPPGTVIISVQPPIGDEQCGITISRKGNEKTNLGESGWQTSRHIFQPRQLEQTSDKTLMVFGSELTTPISLNTSLNICLPDAGIDERHFWPEVTEAYGTSQVHVAVKKNVNISNIAQSTIKKIGNPEDEPPGNEEIEVLIETKDETPAAAAPVEKPKKSNYPLVIGLILMMLAVISAGFWYTYNSPSEPVIALTPKPKITPVEPSFSELYQQYLSQGNHTEELFKLGNKAFEANKIDLAFKALTLSSDRGYAAAHLMVGRWYDPLIVQQSPLRANPNIAADYYAKAIAAENNSEAIQLLSKFCAPRPEDREALLSFNRSVYCQ